MSLLLLLNPSFYFRLLIYMNSYNSTKLYINNQKKTDKPNTIVTWNITNLSIDFIIEKIKILDADIVHLQGIYKDKDIIISQLKDIYYNIVTNDHKQYYMYNDCGLMVLSKYEIYDYHFKPFGYWYSKFYSGSIFYTIDKYNFCNCNLDNKNDEKIYNRLQMIIKNNPYNDNFIIGGYINYKDPYSLFSKRPNNQLYNITSVNNNYIISLNNLGITNNMYDFGCKENPIMGIIDHII